MDIKNCRTDFESFFEKVLKHDNLKTKFKHYPYLVIDNNSITVVENLSTLLREYGKNLNLQLMKQWGGQWSSDFFTFNMLELVMAIEFNKEHSEYNKFAEILGFPKLELTI